MTQAQERKASAEKLFESNMRFASFFAGIAYRTKAQTVNATFDDYLQAALVGLWEAAVRFDTGHGSKAKFIQFARWYVLRATNDASREFRTGIRLPRRILSLIAAEIAGKPLNARDKAIVSSLRSFHSLDAAQTDGTQDLLLVDVERAEPPHFAAERREYLKALFERARLTKQEIDVLSSRFGLAGSEETLEAIGDRYGVTRERVRQLQEGALRKTRKVEGFVK